MQEALVGKGGLSVQVVEDTHDNRGNRMRTLIFEYPRLIHAELLRHRTFNHSVSSSRAIPVPRMIDMVLERPAMPFHWGANQSGMSANGYIDKPDAGAAVWELSAKFACYYARRLHELGLHKQVVNRVLEPYQWIREVVTGTEFENFYKLRIHEAAQPEIHELALLTYEALQASAPRHLSHGEYHLPFITQSPNGNDGSINYMATGTDNPTTDNLLTLDEAITVSMSCCAQSSFRRNDTSLEKATSVNEKLLFSDPVHASPAEHIATPMDDQDWEVRLELKNVLEARYLGKGFSKDLAHAQSDHIMYSGNLRGFSSHRNTIENNVYTGDFNCNVKLESKRFERT